MIHVTIEGFGSEWSRRTRQDGRNPERQHTAYYNTTGVTVGGKVRPRSRIFGQLRFNGVGGFISAGVERNIGRVFQCSAELDGPVHKLIFHHLLDKPQAPDFFMFDGDVEVHGTLVNRVRTLEVGRGSSVRAERV